MNRTYAYDNAYSRHPMGYQSYVGPSGYTTRNYSPSRGYSYGVNESRVIGGSGGEYVYPSNVNYSNVGSNYYGDG